MPAVMSTTMGESTNTITLVRNGFRPCTEPPWQPHRLPCAKPLFLQTKTYFPLAIDIIIYE